MKMKKLIIVFTLVILWQSNISVSQAQEKELVTEEWLSKNMVTEHPRLILNPALENQIKEKVLNDPLYQKYYQYLKQQAENILEEPPLTYKKTGKRLLSVSRMAIKRISILALVYNIDSEEKYLNKLEEELKAVCSFSDWNPSHFLDVAEMTVAVAFAVDWCGDDLKPEIKKLAVNAIVENGLKPGLAVSGHNWWVDVHHNWNLVCHAGLSMGALAVFEEEPEIASYILNRAVEKIPLGLTPYAPDGIYPEGPSYWMYATSYLAMIISSFESTVHTNFNLTNTEGVMESAMYTIMTAGPSGEYFNFFDARKEGFHSMSHLGLLSWFANRDAIKYEKADLENLLNSADILATENDRFAALYFLFQVDADGNLENKSVSESEASTNKNQLPLAWVGQGDNPLGILRPESETGMYLAAKAGRAADNHGNMDAGSFILEWQKRRWSVDLGMQNYYELESTIGNEGLWSSAQNSTRWTLLSKSNFGHSTLTVNAEKHIADARSFLIEKEINGPKPSFSFDLKNVFGDNVEESKRTFQKISDQEIDVTDEIKFSRSTKSFTWQMMTTADVKQKKDGFELNIDGHKLAVKVQNSEAYTLKVVSLSPPPLEYDMNIPGLKRLEVEFKKSAFSGDAAKIQIKLEGLK